MAIRAWMRVVICVAASTVCAYPAFALEPPPDQAAALLAQYALLRERLENSPFPQRLYVESIESHRALQGDVYAVVDYPLGAVSAAFVSPAQWCDALILHLNVKYCRPLVRDDQTLLSVALGKKIDQPLKRAHRVEFVYGVEASQPDFLGVELLARRGPIGSRNIRIAFGAVALEPARTLVHLQFSYRYGLLGGIALKWYLANAGTAKVGFTIVGDPDAPEPEFIRGVRAAIERNTMRYFLAIDAALAARAAPEPERFERSLALWFDACEQYPRQLHEVDRETYLAIKRSEYLRQQASQ